ncbi:unnamed protein product [Rhizoctonia solani]|uniref:Methyltransferase domain-containing protein n=1 Tax=Rhizoctonia solani TaxID=456999 RepID=A0A8H3CXP8_9AGAM|nr:unnamed protein product [Rhizoctonia solani]
MSGNLSRSMRENYDTHGVDEYYKIVGSSYRNPHFPGIKQCLNIFMNNLRLTCGSGEVTVALQEWWSACQNQPTQSASNSIAARPAVPRPVVSPRLVVSPPTPAVSRPAPSFPRISPTEPPLRIVATDPYTSDAYHTRTGLPCIALSFHDVAVEGLPDASKALVPEEQESKNDEDELKTSDEAISHPEDRETYELVICSFALHLLVTPGSLYELLSALSYGARWLVVLEPHKKPEIKEGWGWTQWDITTWAAAQGREGEFIKERVHCRVYKSTRL